MKRIYYILFCFILTLEVFAVERNDSTIYQGINLKLDIGTPILEVARSKARVQWYEMGLNVDLKNRYFPTVELGYGGAKQSADGGSFNGSGAFGRIGLDISALRKYADKDNHLMAGVRFGTAMQGYSLTDVKVMDEYWQSEQLRNMEGKYRTDLWGEVVVGIQVKVYKHFTMGWYARLRILMTRGKDGQPKPYFIPGYGYRQDTNWGLNYYLGWHF